jgi:hypothetical protein
MRAPWNVVALASNGTFLLAGGLIGLSGCDSSSSSGSVKPAYSSPAEVDKQKSELYDAMKGGAYGSAGRRSSPNMDPTKK